MPEIEKKIASAISSLESLRDLFKERTGNEGLSVGASIIRAYEGLDLHKDIAREASKRFLNGHYADAVEAGCNLASPGRSVAMCSTENDDDELEYGRLFIPPRLILRKKACSFLSMRLMMSGHIGVAVCQRNCAGS